MTGTATQAAPPAPPAGQYPHLPPGRAPGPQTRRRGATAGRVVLFAVLLIFGVVSLFFTLLFGGFSLFLLSSGDVVGVLVGLVVALVAVGIPGGMFFAAWRVRSGRKPPQHFAVSTTPQEVRRGDEVTVHLEVIAPDKIGDRLEYGLVCTGWYDDRQRRSSSGNGPSGSRRVAVAKVAWEHWVEAQRSAGTQTMTFRVPPDAPFSYEGRCLSFAWRASAREPKRMAIDPRRDEPIWVSP